MAFIVEDGSGVTGANSNVSVAFVTAYLTARNRQTENNWSSGSSAVLEASCVAATDHIENQIRLRVKGIKEFSDITLARATLAFTLQPADTEIVTIGTIAYRFVNTLAATNDVQIAASLSASIGNLVLAILANSADAGVAYEATTVENPDATGQNFYDDTLLVFAKTAGTPGNAVVTTTTVTGATWNFPTLNGGSDRPVPQFLSFPRRDLIDRDSLTVIGMPTRLLYATSEYAVRAKAAVLAPDPDQDALGGVVQSLREKVGPIDTTTSYVIGTVGIGSIPAYPAADRLLAEFLKSGSPIRG